jgi:hypothetical protein
MFIISIVAAIALGYILGGRIRNLENIMLRGVYLIFISFGLELTIVMCMRKGLLRIGTTTFLLDVVMYLILLIFVMLNRSNICIIIMGVGFLLNAIPIFLNGGAMPVSQEAIKIAGLNSNIGSEGLYTIIDSSTRMWFLGDVIPISFISNFIVSIGDIFTAIGLILLIIIGMKKKKY